MKSQWGRALGSLVVISSLAACGHGGSDDAAQTVSASSTAPTTSSAPSGSPSTSGSASASATASTSNSSSDASGPGTANPSGSTGPSSTTSGTHGSATGTAGAGKTSGTGASSKGATGTLHTGSSSGGASVGTPTSSAVRLSIPSIGLDHALTAGGLSGGVLNPASGTIQRFIGYGRVNPGSPGISVLAGHVTYNGPDVFYRLASVPVGGRVTVSYADGTHKDFVVTGKASVDKTALQNDSRVWGSSGSPVVALVTCDSSSAWVNAQHHANNFVVWARPA